MNGLEKLGCRAYQTVMRGASYFLDFRPPQVIAGAGSLSRLPEAIRARGIDSVLVVTDRSLMKLGLLDPLFAGLKAAGIRHTLYDGVEPNPTIPNIESALAAYDAGGCRAIVAFGGGSPIDCAKAAGARAANRRKSVTRMRGLLKVWRRPPPLFAVPTTAGTGSEATLAAVVTDPVTHEKYAINDPNLMPDVAVLDHSLTAGLPPHITSTTGMDALTHAVEAYIGHSNTRHTRDMAEKAVALVFGNLERAWADGSDLAARESMLLASHYAGIAFTRAYVGYVHTIAHNLGGLYGIPHGLANAVVLPLVLEWYGESAHAPLAKLAAVAGIGSPGRGASDAAASLAFIGEIRAMNRRMGIPEGFTQIREADIPLLARRAMHEGNPLYPVPRIMSVSECEAILRALSS